MIAIIHGGWWITDGGLLHDHRGVVPQRGLRSRPPPLPWAGARSVRSAFSSRPQGAPCPKDDRGCDAKSHRPMVRAFLVDPQAGGGSQVRGSQGTTGRIEGGGGWGFLPPPQPRKPRAGGSGSRGDYPTPVLYAVCFPWGSGLVKKKPEGHAGRSTRSRIVAALWGSVTHVAQHSGR